VFFLVKLKGRFPSILIRLAATKASKGTQPKNKLRDSDVHVRLATSRGIQPEVIHSIRLIQMVQV
jgi:hypothetical protein